MKKVSVWGLILVFVIGISFTACGGNDDDSKPQLSEAQIKEYLESGTGIWEMIEVDNGRATTFHIMFKNGKTSGYTFAGISGINANVSYGINGNFVHQTDASHYEVLEGGIYITEITHTALTGNWCRGLPLTGRKVTQ